jgi:hypothetical protein
MKTLVDMKKFVEACNKVYEAEESLSKAADEFSDIVKPVFIAADLVTLKEMRSLVAEGSQIKTFLEEAVNKMQMIVLLNSMASGEDGAVLQAAKEIVSEASDRFIAEQEGNALEFPGSNAVH